MRRLVLWGLAVLVLAGCGGSGSSPTGPAAGTRTVGAELRDRFLFDHNAAFNDGRTFRWVPPIPIFVLTGDEELDGLVMDQFLAWEHQLAGAGGTPFYTPLDSTDRVPRRGIFLAVADLPGKVVGFGDPFFAAQVPPGGGRRSARLRQLRLPAATRELQIPELTADGQIERCILVLDPVVLDASVGTFRSVVRHEVGHCLGFIGHVSSGLMKPTCCALNFTSDVTGMMRKLYHLPPGSDVTR